MCAREVLSAAGTMHLEIDEGVHAPGLVSELMACHMPVAGGQSVLDLGCGCGLFAIVARRLGAGAVTACDADVRAVENARRNAAANGAGEIEFLVGDWFAPVAGRRFDLVVANPPQLPAPSPARRDKYGGAGGTDQVRRVVDQAPAHLAAGGSLLFGISGLADPEGTLALLSERFRSVRVLAEGVRPFDPAEYDGYAPGTFAHLQKLRAEGRSAFERSGSGYAFKVYAVQAREAVL